MYPIVDVTAKGIEYAMNTKDLGTILLGNNVSRCIAVFNLGERFISSYLEDKSGKLITKEDFGKLKETLNGVKEAKVYSNQGILVKTVRKADEITHENLTSVVKKCREKTKAAILGKEQKSEKTNTQEKTKKTKTKEAKTEKSQTHKNLQKAPPNPAKMQTSSPPPQKKRQNYSM